MSEMMSGIPAPKAGAIIGEHYRDYVKACQAEVDQLRAELAETVQACSDREDYWQNRLRAELAESHESIMRLNDWLNGFGIPAVDAIARVREWAETYIYADHDRDSFLRALDGSTE